ncbi:Cysteine Protease [Parasponia andersonii]|uniref:Cysteine Protease n=1 Tax=Parasponia andersonii TaxID=3476 RepID=A0A2P5AB55_PARAD|nr:Cysteine Protease [Parasponia andersonii]
MDFAFLAFLILGTCASQAMSRTLHEAALIKTHEQWMSQHGRTYANNAEKEMRLEIFNNNLKYVDKFNKEGNRTYKLGVNPFTDLTNEEFLNHFTGLNMPIRSHSTSSAGEYNTFLYKNLTANDVPISVDWRNQGAVSNVKYQGSCASCWAFCSVAAVEGLIKIKTGKQLSLSEQQLLDCSYGNGNYGCSGGLIETAFEYIIQNKGLASETSYPYQDRDDLACQAGNKAVDPATKITGYERVPEGEEALLKAVSGQPVALGIESSWSFRMYRSGVFSGDDCGMTRPNHCITLVGYGTTEDGTKYWLAKNSWGRWWGENGYIRILRDVQSSGGVCGLAIHASYPTFTTTTRDEYCNSV